MIEVRALGYVVVEATRVDAWCRYAQDMLGMQALDTPDGAPYLKMDERDFRYLIVPGNADCYHASGWELADAAAFDAACAALQRAGIEPIRATRDEAALRRVRAMVWREDPSGNRHELYWRALRLPPLRVAARRAALRHRQHGPRPRGAAGAAVRRDRRIRARRARLRAVRHLPRLPREIHARSGGTGEAHPLHALPQRAPSQHRLFEMAAPSGCVHVMAEVDSMDESAARSTAPPRTT